MTPTRPGNAFVVFFAGRCQIFLVGIVIIRVVVGCCRGVVVGAGVLFADRVLNGVDGLGQVPVFVRIDIETATDILGDGFSKKCHVLDRCCWSCCFVVVAAAAAAIFGGGIVVQTQGQVSHQHIDFFHISSRHGPVLWQHATVIIIVVGEKCAFVDASCARVRLPDSSCRHQTVHGHVGAPGQNGHAVTTVGAIKFKKATKGSSGGFKNVYKNQHLS